MFAGNWRRAFEKTNSVRNLLLFFPSCMLPSLTQLAEFKVWAKLSSSRCSGLCSLRLSHGLPRCPTRSSIMDCAASLPAVFSCPALTCKSTIRRIIPSSFTAFQIWRFGWSFLLPLTASSIFCIISFSAISIEHLSFNWPNCQHDFPETKRIGLSSFESCQFYSYWMIFLITFSKFRYWLFSSFSYRCSLPVPINLPADKKVSISSSQYANFDLTLRQLKQIQIRSPVFRGIRAKEITARRTVVGHRAPCSDFHAFQTFPINQQRNTFAGMPAAADIRIIAMIRLND